MTEGDAMMQEHKCTCYCGGSMFYRHLHADNCPLAVHGEEAPKSKEYEAAYAAGRMAGLREAADICRKRSVYYEQEEHKCAVDDSVRCIRGIQRNESAGCLEQIEQAAQGVKE